MTKARTLSLIAFATTVIGGASFLAGNAVAQPPVPTATLTTSVERHPEIRKAMRQLNAALKTMHDAADDFHGHKAKAMDLANGAVAELKAALASDRH